MKCAGKYKHKRSTYECLKKWGCKNYTFRVKKQNWIPESKTGQCEFYEQIMGTT